MQANVWEWCEDIYDEGFYGKPEARETDPCSDTGSEFRVMRGGTHGGEAGFCRSSDRVQFVPTFRSDVVGCRPAYRLP